MKKVVLGTGLIICGVLGILASILRDAIFFASPNNIIRTGTDTFLYMAIVVLVLGIILNVLGFLEDMKK